MPTSLFRTLLFDLALRSDAGSYDAFMKTAKWLMLFLMFFGALSGQLPQAEENNRFSFDLWQKLKNKEGNLVFSPYSVSGVFAMAYFGAKGETAQEMASVLHFPESPQVLGDSFLQLHVGLSKDPSLQVANSCWIDGDFSVLNSFKLAMERYFESSLNLVSFNKQPLESRTLINEWVAKRTHDKIQNLLSPQDINKDTKMVLIGVIYLQAPWRTPFLAEKTEDKPFSTGKNVPMMHLEHSFSYYEEEDVKVLEIPYQGANLALWVVLPDDLNKWETSLSYDKLQRLMQKAAPAQVDLLLPRFKSENTLSLNELLMAMGLNKAFSSQADFSGIDGKRDLEITKALQKAYISVDEKGTEAAAATAISIGLTSIMIPTEPPKEFHADHPFLYFIVDNLTGQILFMGRLVEP